MVTADAPALMAANRSYRYGEGLFETMKVVKGKILLEDYHAERLFTGLNLLKFKIPASFTRQKINDEILKLCRKNNCDDQARVRLSVSGGSGGLFDSDEKMQYIIECRPLSESVNSINVNGLVIGLYTEVRKSCDIFSNLKSANYLPYVLAARFANENKWNDCLMLNQHERICDATTANVFWIKDELVFTPPISEGCVAGVMRKYLLEKLPAAGYKLQEKRLESAELVLADEIFLTNAVYGLRWVKQFRDRIYSNIVAEKIYYGFIRTI
jgi:branched-chain amino acid aminotransferase